MMYAMVRVNMRLKVWPQTYRIKRLAALEVALQFAEIGGQPDADKGQAEKPTRGGFC